MRKLKAFTIIELTVITLLSGIVISIAYFVFFILQKQYNTYDKTGKYQLEITTLSRLLTEDFQKSDSIISSSEKSLLTYKNNIVTDYKFDVNYITRSKSSVTDTFHFNTENTVLLLDEVPVSVPGIWIDELKFETNYHQKKLSFHFYKKYAVAPFISKDNHNQ